MKKIVLTFIVFAFLANVSAQLKVNSLGNIGIGKDPQYKLDVAGDICIGSASNIFGTTNNNAITFKVNNTLAGFTGSSGNTNVSFGYWALFFNTTTNRYNTAIGYSALYGNTASSNTATGYYALNSNITGNNNTATGSLALCNNTASNNTAIGCQALIANTIGSNNTAIGYNAGVSTSNLTNATAIGYNAIATASDQVVIGNTSVIKIVGGNNITIISDGRTKKNIRTDVPGLAFINHLQPVTYNLDLDVIDALQKSDDPRINARIDSLRMARSPEEKEIETKARVNKEKEVQSGFIAQDVEKAARSVGYDFSGVDTPENDKGLYGLRYAEFVVPLVKAVQELSAQNDSLQEQVNELTRLVNKLLEKDDKSNVLKSASSDTSATGLTELTNVAASLEQNIPNPFNQTTVIRYTLPETCTSAKILITNNGGKIIQQIPLSATGGTDSITIKGGSLQADVYLYSLICDGKIVDTKRMILTK